VLNERGDHGRGKIGAVPAGFTDPKDAGGGRFQSSLLAMKGKKRRKTGQRGAGNEA